jgi:hypothetical protein
MRSKQPTRSEVDTRMRVPAWSLLDLCWLACRIAFGELLQLFSITIEVQKLPLNTVVAGFGIPDEDTPIEAAASLWKQDQSLR